MKRITDQVINVARREALKSNQKRAQMSAVVLGAEAPLRAYNYNLIEGYKLSIHAEEHLVIKAAKMGIPLENSSVLVYRANGRHKSKPCKRCWHLLQKVGVKEVLYFDEEWKKERIQ